MSTKQDRILYNAYPKLKRYYKVINAVTLLDAFFSDIISDNEYLVCRETIENYGTLTASNCGYCVV